MLTSSRRLRAAHRALVYLTDAAKTEHPASAMADRLASDTDALVEYTEALGATDALIEAAEAARATAVSECASSYVHPHSPFGI